MRKADRANSIRACPHSTSSASLQLRLEVYNVTNTASFANPNGQLGNAAFGTITSTLGTPRQMQFAVKFLF